MTSVAVPQPRVSLPIAWDSIARAELHVEQTYRYEYTSPVHDLRQRLMMLPPERHGGQRLLTRNLRIDGADDVRVLSRTDRFGNVAYAISSATVLHAVEFTAEFSVRRFRTAGYVRVLDADIPLYSAPTALTAPCARIVAAANVIRSEINATPLPALSQVLPDGRGLLDDAEVRLWAAAARGALWAARAITYQSGVTGVQTPAAMALHMGFGVCQDYAHLALAILRELGVAARYVSGHLIDEGAPHAWIESILPDPQTKGYWRAAAYDPTHRSAPGLNYITVAVGRDYGDITPTSGTFHGARGQFTSRKTAWVESAAS